MSQRGWVFADNFHSGPRSSRKMSNAGFLEFRTEDAARRFLDAVPDRGVELSCGSKVKARFALTEFNMRRNWPLRKAEELIKSSAHAKDKRVAIDFSSRAVKVDGRAAFEQSRDETGGVFRGAFSSLVLP